MLLVLDCNSMDCDWLLSTTLFITVKLCTRRMNGTSHEAHLRDQRRDKSYTLSVKGRDLECGISFLGQLLH